MKRIFIATLLVSIALTQYGCYSCSSWHGIWGTGPVESAGEHSFWFSKDCRTITPDTPAPAPAPKPQSPAPVRKAKPAPKPVVTDSQCGPNIIQVDYPCSACKVIVLTKQLPATAIPGTTFDYTVRVENVSSNSVSNIIVTEKVPAPLEIIEVTPEAQVNDGVITWKAASFDPGQSVTFTITVKVGEGECAVTCADVKYDTLACAAIRLVKPALALKKIAPPAVLACEPIPVKLIVTNPGTGTAKNVTVTDVLPEGLTTDQGKTKLVFDAGDLAAGQSKQFTAILTAETTGKFVNKAVANAAGGLKADASTTTVVTKPALVITKTGPKKRYLGRSVSYEITLANEGDAPASNVVIKDTIPAGVTDVVASDRGIVASNNTEVTWNIPSLKAGATKKVIVSYKPTKIGTVRDTATATAKCAEAVKASAQTVMAGIPALLLEVIDVDDPIELGGTTTYVITATNQGSAVGTNISIVCELEENEEFVSAGGATVGTLSGSKITFVPLKKLAPKAKATWRVVVKAVKEGDVRFKVTMNTDQITRPVEETESTHLYE